MTSSKSGGVEKAVKDGQWIGDLVESLFTNGGGEKATRLVLMDDDNGLDLGGLCRAAVRDRILDAIRSKPSRPAPRQKGER